MREAAALIASGKTAEDAARQIGVSMQTFHRWKSEYSGAKEEIMKRLKALENENQQLKKD